MRPSASAITGVVMFSGTIVLCTSAIAQLAGPQPFTPAAITANLAAEAQRQLDAGVEDINSLQVSLLNRPPDLRHDNNFEHVYRADDGRFYRRAGATVAFFAGSEYVLHEGQSLPLIPAGTVFYPCGFPGASCGGDLARSLAHRPISCAQPCGAGNALSGGHAPGQLLGPRERHDVRCTTVPLAGAELATEFATRQVNNRAAQSLVNQAIAPVSLDRAELRRVEHAPITGTAPAMTATLVQPDRLSDARLAAVQEAERVARLKRLAQRSLDALQ